MTLTQEQIVCRRLIQAAEAAIVASGLPAAETREDRMRRALAIGHVAKLLGRADFGITDAELNAALQLLARAVDKGEEIEYDVSRVFLAPFVELAPSPPATPAEPPQRPLPPPDYTGPGDPPSPRAATSADVKPGENYAPAVGDVEAVRVAMAAMGRAL